MTDHEKELVDKLLDAGLSRYSAVDPPPDLEQRLLTALKVALRGEESVDDLLEAGLARYAAVEPPPGLDRHILAGLSRPAGPQPLRWLDWRWAGALATAAVVALVFVVFSLRQPPPPTVPPQTASIPAPVTPAPVAPEPRVAPTPQVAKATLRRAPGPLQSARTETPRLDTFPAPAPLSEQERLLLRFVRQTPREQLVARQLGAGPIERLDIQRLSVAPLELRETTTEN